jgi:hypothetical protein
MSFKKFLRESEETPIIQIYRSNSSPKDFFKSIQSLGLEFKR